MANLEATDFANEEFNTIAMKAIISVAVAINLGFAGAMSPALHAALVVSGLGLAGWLLVEQAPNWLLRLSVLARINDFTTAGPRETTADIACAVDFAIPEVATAELLNFDPVEATQESWSPADILKITDPDEIFSFALNYNKEAPEIASRNLRFVIKEWGAKPETKIIWMNAIKKIEFHNDGQAMANLFFGGEPPIVTYTNAQGQPVSCWEDSLKLPSQMHAS